MNSITMMQFRNAEDSQKLAALYPRLAELRRQMKGYQNWMIANANDAAVIAKLRPKVKDTEAEIADVEKQIRAIKEWKRPTLEQLRRVDQLWTLAYQFSLQTIEAQVALQKAEREERPLAAAEARKRLAEAQAEYPRALSQVRKAIETLGLDPTPMCGEAA